MNKSLAKFIDFFWITFLSAILLYSLVDIKTIFSTLKEVQKEKIIYVIKMENSTIAPLIKFGFDDTLKKELKHFLEMNKEIKYIKINNLVLGKKFKDLKIIVSPVVYKNKKIATMTIGYSNKVLVNSFAKKYFTKFIIYFLLILIISVSFLIFIRKKVKSLKILAKQVEKLNFKKHPQLEVIDSYFEIINITNAINKLLRQINKFYNNQRNMMKKIIIYKKELETAQKIANMFSWQYHCETQILNASNFSFFKHKLNLETINDFIEHIEEKNNIFSKLSLCQKSINSLEEIITLNLAGKRFYFKIEAQFMKSKNIIIGICIDITEDIKRQEKISFLAYHDPLTGLVNRSFLKEELKTLISFANRYSKKIALVFIDLDNFKFINDTFGHEIGDKLLIEIAHRLQKCIRNSDIAARIGGDEFVLVLNDINSKEDVENKIKNIMKTLTTSIIIDNNKMEVTFSAGISIYPDDAKDILELFQFSDIAMYNAKKEGKNGFKFITNSLKKQVENFYSTLEELKNGLKKEELILFFQPKVNVIENKIEGVESLIRWNHPQKGILTPYHFIDIAEKGGIIHLIDSYVLKKAIFTLKNWMNDEILKDLSIAVNVSANKFLEPHFVDEIKYLIDTYKINPTKLQIEITESLSIQNFDYTILTLDKIKDIGIKIALDDFGTGYSSLNYIKKIPFDILKIDQSFIKDLSGDEDDVIITKMIIEMSKILKKDHVAEGVENEKNLKIVRNLGVEIVQGYYFSKPLPEDKLKEFIKNFGKTQ